MSVSGPNERLTRSPGRLHAAAVVAAGEKITAPSGPDLTAPTGPVRPSHLSPPPRCLRHFHDHGILSVTMTDSFP